MKRKTTQQNLQHLTIEERHQVKQQFFRLYKKSGNVAASARALDICLRTATRWVRAYKIKGEPFALGALPSYFDPDRPNTDTPLHPFPVAPEPTRNASISVMIIPQGGTIPPEFGIQANGETVVESVWNQPLTYDNISEWIDFLNSGEPGSLMGVARASLDAELLTQEATGDWAGARGNRLTLETYAPSPWGDIPDPHFSGGEG